MRSCVEVWSPTSAAPPSGAGSDSDALRPWYHRSWIFPRDPDFAEKAARILDLYEGRWQGSPLGEDDFVLSADEKNQHPSASA